MPGIGTAIGIPFKKVRGIAQSILDEIFGFAVATDNIKTGAIIKNRKLKVDSAAQAYGILNALNL